MIKLTKRQEKIINAIIVTKLSHKEIVKKTGMARNVVYTNLVVLLAKKIIRRNSINGNLRYYLTTESKNCLLKNNKTTKNDRNKYDDLIDN